MTERAKTAVLLVEEDFANTHVGVRRVIVDYWTRLQARGYSVDLAVAHKGQFQRVRPDASRVLYDSMSAAQAPSARVTWRSGRMGALPWPRRRPAPRNIRPVDYLDIRLDPVDYDVSIITTPWICERPLPDRTFTHGIVYDMIPNLLAVQELELGVPNFDVLHFARAHHLGYQHYVDRVRTILCISESTRRDFLRFYAPAVGQSVVVDIPFASPPIGAVHRRRRKRGTLSVLMVNVLDPRKGIEQAGTALATASKSISLRVDVVGRERMPPKTVYRQLERIAMNGARVRWRRDVSDSSLMGLYAASDVLLFPSLYEGLGLPILEAQAMGTPVISGSGSSMGEVNLNPSLAIESGDNRSLVKALLTVRSDPSIVRGDPLISAVDRYLDRNHRFERTLLPYRAGEHADAPVPGLLTRTGSPGTDPASSQGRIVHDHPRQEYGGA